MAEIFVDDAGGRAIYMAPGATAETTPEHVREHHAATIRRAARLTTEVSQLPLGAALEALSIAQAVHNAGGTVVCQVERLAQRGTLHPQMVRVPGFLIDHFVVDPEQMQNYAVRFDPSLCGETTRPLSRATSK